MNCDIKIRAGGNQSCLNLQYKERTDTCHHTFSRFQLWNLPQRGRRFDWKVIWAARGWMNFADLVIELSLRASGSRSTYLECPS